MANLFEQTKMTFWRLRYNDADITYIVRDYISSLKIDYELNKITTASISINSKSYVESYFRVGQKIEIDFGWSPTSMIPMFTGKIASNPQGQADEKISYTLTCAGKSMKMARAQKRRRFVIPKKSEIIAQIVSENGYIPVLDIADKNFIKASYMPMQRNKTDYEYLIELAQGWNCVMWVDDHLDTIYFMDADKAHDAGNLIKKINAKDLLTFYSLGYRTNLVQNNVANLKWKYGASQGISTGTNKPSGGANEDMPEAIETEDARYVVVDGTTYELNKATSQKMAETGGYKVVFDILSKGVLTSANEFEEEIIKEYFTPVTKGISTHKGDSHRPEHKARNITLDVQLNVGDPYLRPPRKTYLKSGTRNPKADTSDLPAFLLDNSAPRIYHINKVSTEISNGMMSTSLSMTR